MNKFIYILFSFLIITLSCDAPRENPFDPNSVNYYDPASDSVSTKIHILHLSPSTSGIPEVEVFARNIHMLKFTNVSGIAEFIHTPVDSLIIISEHKNYFSDTTVFTELQKQNNLQIRLNAKPEISDLQFTSFFENLNGNESITSLSINTQVYDVDGLADIKQVMIEERDAGFRDTLKLVNTLEQRYAKNFALSEISSELNSAQLPELNFGLIITNENADSIVQTPLKIIRVIAESPVLITPESGSAQTDTVFFQWEEIHLDYEFTFNIVLQRLGGEISSYTQIPCYKTGFTVSGLTAGIYYYNLQIEDNLGNICQSPYISFTYQP